MRKTALAALAAVLLISPLHAKTIRTIAGTGVAGFSGDGGVELP